MGGPAVVVDVHPVGLVGQHMALRTQFREQQLRRAGGRAVCTVDANPHTGQRKRDRALDVVHIITHHVRRSGYAADVAPCGDRRNVGVVEDDGLDLLFERIWQLIAVAAENFDPIELAGVVRRCEHHARVRFVFADQERHRRGRHNTELHNISPHAAQASCNCTLQHIGRNARVFSDQNFRMAVVVVRQHHRRRPADVHGHLTGKLRICDASDAVRSKKSAHSLTHSLKSFPFFRG